MSCLSSVDSPDRAVFVRRKRAKAGDDTVSHHQQSSEGLGEGSQACGRPSRRAAAKAPILEDSTSYEESNSEGAYQPERKPSPVSGFVDEDDEEDEESSSPD